ncbi:MAG: tetratricopeptide repeat protein, partial [Thermoanaerobaculia bacterium]
MHAPSVHRKDSPLRKLIPPVAVLLACAALSAALAYAAAPKNLDRAIAAQRALLAERPADSALENDLGSLLALGDDFAGAEQAYRRALELDGANSSAHFNLGLLLQRQGERRQALKEFKRTIELAPRHAWAHYQVGTIYDAQGHDSAARKAYAKALALDPALGNPEVNPHLIDNELATSAMLYSYRHYREELLPAKEYEEPARIARVLIDRPVSDADAVAAAAQAPGAEGGFVRGSGASQGTAGGEDTAAAGEADEPMNGEPADGGAADARVLTSKDLDPTRTSGQIVGGGAPARFGGGGKPVGGPITSGNRGRTRDTQPPLRPTLRTLPSTGAPPTTFLPTSDSTGMMETRLVEID